MASNGNEYRIVEVGEKSNFSKVKKESQVDGWLFVSLFSDPLGTGPVLFSAVFARPIGGGRWPEGTEGAWLANGREGARPGARVAVATPIEEIEEGPTRKNKALPRKGE
jgi:hypothetical protein